MSFDYRFEPPTLRDWDDDYLEECDDCTFDCDNRSDCHCDCWIHGYCINEVE